MYVGSSRNVDWRVARVIALMQEDLRRPRDVGALGRAVNLSPSRLAHLFQADVGCGPARYLRNLRLDHARALAEHSTLSVKEIMAQVGFNDPSHFARLFTRRHGVSARALRVRARRAAPVERRVGDRRGRPPPRPSSTIGQLTVETANSRPESAAG